VVAHAVERGIVAQPQRVEGLIVVPLHALAYLLQPYALHPANRVGEIPVDHRMIYAHALEYLGRLIGLYGGYAHL